MAIAFAQVSIHSRSKGHSAVAASAYRTGSKLLDSRTGLTHHFSSRDDVVFTTILLPEGGNDQFLDRQYLWNQALDFKGLKWRARRDSNPRHLGSKPMRLNLIINKIKRLRCNKLHNSCLELLDATTVIFHFVTNLLHLIL